MNDKQRAARVKKLLTMLRNTVRCGGNMDRLDAICGELMLRGLPIEKDKMRAILKEHK
jgi:hypothetical protein